MALTDEPLIPLAEATAFFGKARGKALHTCTLTRWVIKGVRAGGRVVRLEAVKQGVRWMTSRAAAERFLAATTDAALRATASPTQPPPAQTSLSHQLAEKRLAAVGW